MDRLQTSMFPVFFGTTRKSSLRKLFGVRVDSWVDPDSPINYQEDEDLPNGREGSASLR